MRACAHARENVEERGRERDGEKIYFKKEWREWVLVSNIFLRGCRGGWLEG